MAAAETLQGTVFFRERMALPPGAVAEVQLVDVSRADAPAEVIAGTKVAAGPGSPIHYTLEFDRSRIVPKRTYALQARISHEGQLLFINTTRHAIFAGGEDKTDILVHRTGGGAAPQPGSAVGKWLAEDIRGGGVIDRLQSVLEIAADGKVTGSGGCNRISGQAKLEGERLSFGRLATTQMACTPAAMDQEHKFLDALEHARSFKFHPLERKLFLLDANGQMLMRLVAMG